KGVAGLPAFVSPALVREVGFSAQNVGYLFFRPWRDGFISLELRNARLIGSRDVVVRSVVVRHGGSFGRCTAKRTWMSRQAS
ncbi:hypothetical protein PUW81_008225, partial [Microbacterium sp. NM3R9]|uniref:hypothetical protein n=1 Tax=Microbacterium thalli TaxID=3027921 RepID=UPI00264F636D